MLGATSPTSPLFAPDPSNRSQIGKNTESDDLTHEMTSERPASPPIPASSTSTSSPSASTVLVDATGDKWEGQHRTEKNSLEEEGGKESGVVVDAVFGDEGDDGPSYKTLGWKGAT